MNLVFQINGREVGIEVSDSELLLDTLRRIGFSSVREGCGVGACGSCTVLVDGKSVSSCLVLTSRCNGASILTSEGLADDDPVVSQFIRNGAAQCGYCIPGFVMMVSELLSENPTPTEQDVYNHLEGNICRCGSYPEIIQAAMDASKAKQTSKLTG